MRYTVWPALLLFTAIAAHAAPEPTPASGGWIGWAYIGEGGDLPLRIWLSDGPDGPDGPDGLTARFDGVAWRQTGWPAELAVDGDRAVMTLETPKGSPIRLEGAYAEGRWAGEIAAFGYEGDFELLHAPGLADISPEDYADVADYYRMSDGDVLEARSLGWGEIVVRSIGTGEQRTLLPVGENRFMTGPARYVPTPVEAWYEVLRTPDGEITELLREAAEGGVTRGIPFDLRTEDVAIESGDAILAATITRPDDDRHRPGVAILGGSAWETRQRHAFQVRNLAALGFTVVHWDKRGFGESTGTDPVPYATTAADAIAAAEFLRRRDDVTAIGYFGVSRGGWTAPLAVAQDGAAAFLILFVPPAASPAVQEQGARLDRLRDEGFSEDDIELIGRMLDAAWRFIETDADAEWEVYLGLRKEAVDRAIPKDVMPPGNRLPDEWHWARMNMLYDPQPILREITIPVLAIYGENDRAVLTGVHRPLMEEALAGNDDVTIVTVPDVPHNLARPWSSPHHRTTGIGPEGFDLVMDWARERDLDPVDTNVESVAGVPITPLRLASGPSARRRSARRLPGPGTPHPRMTVSESPVEDRPNDPRAVGSSTKIRVFLALAFGISWGTYAVRRAIASDPAVDEVLRLVVKFGPSLAGIVVAVTYGGWRGLVDVLRRLRIPLRHPGWLVVALGLPIAILFVALPIRAAFGGSIRPLALPPFGEGAALFGTLLAQRFFLGGGLGEELGWRGVMLPELQSRMGALRASIIIGLVHGAWHLPAFGPGVIPLTVFTVSGSIVFTWMYNRTEGNLFLPVLMHASSNASMQFVEGLIPSIDGEFLYPVLVMAVWAVVAAFTVPRLRSDESSVPAAGPRELQ